MCGLTCFGRLPAHHQEHTTALGVSGFTVGEQLLHGNSRKIMEERLIYNIALFVHFLLREMYGNATIHY